jgi:hypothetical protein
MERNTVTYQDPELLIIAQSERNEGLRGYHVDVSELKKRLRAGVVAWHPCMVSKHCVLALLLRYHTTEGDLV